MKYPQLVSPRAVNAISDWLVSRLEQLGVESPQIYTRLLLSLLQSSVQVNDPIEFSNLEAFFATRKGGHNKRFHLPSDTETLKKLNAVQCLREIVSNEHETAAIELLVNELCEKLKDIEKRSEELNNEEGFLIDTQLNIETTLTTSEGAGSHQQRATSQQQHLCRNANILTANDPRRLLDRETALKDNDNDPKKRYFRAFPALTKEMEDSFRVWRRNAKSLTWPVVGRSIVPDNSLTSHSSSASSSLSSSNIGSQPNCEKVLENNLKKDHLAEELNTEKDRAAVVDICESSGAVVGSEVQGAAVSSKKKSKRRRNQTALSKGKTAQNIRKITLGNNSSNPGVTTGGGGRFYNQHHYGHHRNTSSPAWDTDFKGCWEMGPDLIKEFLARQKITTKRSRSNSERMDHTEHNDECSNAIKDVAKVEEFYPGKERPTMKRYFDISFCCDEEDRHLYENEECEGVDYVDEDYDDENALAVVPALISNSGNPRRLYQREGFLQKPLVVCGAVKAGEVNAEEQFDFANFKAKFNSSVEALWKGDEPQTALQSDDISSKGNVSAFCATTSSLNAQAPLKQDMWNFWSRYNQHHYDPASTSSMITTCLDDSSASSGAGAGAASADIANSSDYFSMPSNLDDFDKSVGAVRRHNEAGASLGTHTPSINVFLQNSIWSSSGDCVDAAGVVPAGETDESFLYKVWHSNKKLSQIDVANNKDEMMLSIFRDAKDEPLFNSVGENGAKLDFPPYSSLKWSEGINAGPLYNNVHSNNAGPDLGMDCLPISDNRYAAFGSAATVTGANWEAPAYGQNVQPDLKSWCASNPVSLTEMYGSDVCDSITQESQSESDEMGPAVTLPNHCEETSGFIAYARIKQCGLIQPQSKPLQLQSASASRMSKDYFRVGEEENLLTSESTHFHPIESFLDGHSFSISDALDVIEFERSDSGYLLYDSYEYSEFKRNDGYVSDVELSNTSMISVTTESRDIEPKDMTKNVTKNMKTEGEESSKDTFVIKFRMKRTGEMSCQTDDADFQMAAAKMAEEALPIERSEMPMFYNKEVVSSSQQSNKDAIIAAVTNAVANAAKVVTQRGSDSGCCSLPWVPVTNQHRQSWLDYPSLCDEVDSCIGKVDTEQLNQYWSMQAVEKQCHQRRLSTNTFERMVDIDRNDENSMDNSAHTLWGMCAVCNSCDYGKSMPANRMLRAELNLEADEIMNDLRYMQDLYIGEAADYCSDSADFDINSDILKMNDCKEDNSLGNGKTTTNVDHVQATMLQKVNQLIEDLLRPEQTGKLMKMACESEAEKEDGLNEDDINMTNAWSLNNDDTLMEHNNINAAQSWHYGNGQLANIWQHEPENVKKVEYENDTDDRKNAFKKPMTLLRQVGGSLNEEDLYMDKLNWEHENLAKIWQPNASTTPQPSISVQKNEDDESHESDKDIAESQEIVEMKNLKNRQCITRTSPSSDVLATATYKRVQQFLNNSAAKLKLAANRKRRHSASQNFYHQQQQLNLSNNNNNNDYIADLNRYKLKIATSEAPEQLPLEHEPKQTFITCKYWTTTTNGTQASLDSAAAAMMLLAAASTSRTDGGVIATPNYDDANDVDIMLEENAFGNAISCHLDKNASILKHVAMMARPLTR